LHGFAAETINDFASGRKVAFLGLVEERVSNPAQALGRCRSAIRKASLNGLSRGSSSQSVGP
jgi:hypothetical protein